MGRKCSVFGCKSGYRSDKTKSTTKLHFYRFPKNPVQRKRWVDSLSTHLRSNEITKNMTVCSLHFPSDVFTKISGKYNVPVEPPTVMFVCDENENSQAANNNNNSTVQLEVEDEVEAKKIKPEVNNNDYSALRHLLSTPKKRVLRSSLFAESQTQTDYETEPSLNASGAMNDSSNITPTVHFETEPSLNASDAMNDSSNITPSTVVFKTEPGLKISSSITNGSPNTTPAVDCEAEPDLKNSSIMNGSSNITPTVRYIPDGLSISTKEYLRMVQDRPPLWQKEHPEFSNRRLRQKLWEEVGQATEMSVAYCTKKLKNLRDTMRRYLKKLPTTPEGLPDYDTPDIRNYITWPYYNYMLFLKDEFIIPTPKPGNTTHQSTSQLDDGSSMEDKKIIPFPVMMTTNDDNDSSSGSESSSTNPSYPPPHQYNKVVYPPELNSEREASLSFLDGAVSSDHFITFALDIANDLRKIKNPVKLIQAKASIRRIAEDYVISDLLQNDPSVNGGSSSNSKAGNPVPTATVQL